MDARLTSEVSTAIEVILATTVWNQGMSTSRVKCRRDAPVRVIIYTTAVKLKNSITEVLIVVLLKKKTEE